MGLPQLSCRAAAASRVQFQVVMAVVQTAVFVTMMQDGCLQDVGSTHGSVLEERPESDGCRLRWRFGTRGVSFHSVVSIVGSSQGA